jgi:O-antigen/teichoic acid export membrane protein
MLNMISLVYGGVVVNMVAQAFDGVLIAGLLGLKYVGIYAFLVYVANIIQVPQRSIQAVTIPHLSQAWKDKDYARINRIYHRTSINMLIICSALFCLIELCAPDAGHLFAIKGEYQFGLGLNALWLLGVARIIDAGTGVNGQIIGTSVYWRFDFITGVVLLSLRIPLNIVLIKHYGITGSATADMLSLVVYNMIRMIFLARKFGMQPFTYRSALAVLFAAAAYFLARWACGPLHGWAALFAKALCFVAVYGAVVLLAKLTPDAQQLWAAIRSKVLPGSPKD